MLVSCRWHKVLCKWRSVWFATTATATRRRRMNARLFVCGRSFLAMLPEKQKARDNPGPLHLLCADRSEVHAAARRHGRHRFLLLRQLCDHRFRGDQKARDGCRILDRGTHNLGRVDDALGYQVAVFARLRIEAVRVLSFSSSLPTTTEPSAPALIAIWRAGVWIALRTMSMPCFWSSFSTLRRLSASTERSRATPPPGRMPSSTAARVACIASSTRSLRSLTSTSVAPPTRITATPPASFASRSWSFSRS